MFFVFNFHPSKSFPDYGFDIEKGSYKIVLNSDSKVFGGFDRIDNDIIFNSLPYDNAFGNEQLKIYLPNRTALVLSKQIKTDAR